MQTEVLNDMEKNIEEESSLFSKVFVASRDYKWISEEVLVVIVRVNKTNFSENFSDIEVCGKSVLKWAMMATHGKEQIVIEEQPDEKILQALKNLKTEKKYIFLQYSDTPYLEKSTFNQILDYFSVKQFNFMGLPRGFVVKTDYLKNLFDLRAATQRNFGNKDFVQIKTSQDLTEFYNFARDRILNYHRENGVVLLGENICIDADVEIGSGVIIYENNFIKGQSYIGENVVLKENNLIIDSIIESGSKVIQSYIEKSKVKEKSVVGPCAKIFKESV